MANVQELVETVKGMTVLELNEFVKALQEEFTALSQYFIHSEMCENWKYDLLSKHLKKLSSSEIQRKQSI